MALPVFDSEWFELGAADKIARFTAAGTTLDELRSIADEGTIQWMITEGGWNPPAQYQPEPVYVEPEPVYYEPEPWWVTQQREEEQRIAREQNEARQARVNEILSIQGLSAEQKGRFYLNQLARGYSDASLRQEVESILGYQSAWPELQQIARNLQQQDQQAEAARQEAARVEAARVETARAEAARIEAEREEAARQEAIRLEAERVEAARIEQERIEAARQEAARQEAARVEAARIATEQQSTRDAASAVGVNLPSNWFDFSAEDKARWLTDAKVTEGQILQIAGASGLDALKEYGYYDVPAKLAAEAEAARLESERQQAEKNEQLRVAQEQKNTDQINKFGMTADEFKTRLTEGNPSDLLMDQRLLEITLEKSWSPQLAVDMVNTAFGTSKTIDDYTRAMSKVLQDPITKLVQNGATADEIRNIAKTIGVDETTTNAAISTAIKTKAASAIQADVTKFLDEAGNVSMAKIVEYADGNKLAYADVQEALKEKFPKLTTDMLVYEKDRQQIDSIATESVVDGKTVRTVDLSKALGLAISKGIELDNLSKFFSKTPDEFKTLVSDNLGSIATAIRDSGTNAPVGLADLLGIDQAATNSAMKSQDFIVGLNKLADSKGNIPFDKALDYASKNNIGPYTLAGYLKVEPEQIFKYQKDQAIASDLNKLADDKGQIAFDKALEYASTNKMSIEDLASYIGVKPDQLTQYQTDIRVKSGLDLAAGEDKQLSYDEIIKFASDNKMNLSDVVNYIGTPESRKDLLTGIQDYVTAKEADAKLTGQERLTNQLNEITNGGTTAGVWDKNQGWDHHSKKMVDYLTQYGITDLNQIGTRVETRSMPTTERVGEGDDFRMIDGEQAANYVVYFDKKTGKELQAVPQSDNGGMWRFGSEGEGTGTTGYFLGQTAGGGAGIASNWEEKYGAKEYALPLAVAAAFAAPYLLPELIGGVVGGVELAALGGEMTAGTGLTGMLMSAGMPAAIAAPTATAIARGTYQGLVNEAAGGDFAKGFIAGGVAPALGQIATNYTYYNLPEELSNSQAVIVSRAVGNAVTQLVTNGELNVTQMIGASITPAAIDAVVNASDGALTNAQAKLLVQTVLSGGQNITAMAQNPMAVMNFVTNNSKLIDEIASGVSNATNRITLSGLTDDQQRSLAEVSEPGSDIAQLASNTVTVTAGSDTAIGAEGLDVIPSGSSTTTPSVTVTAPSTPIGDQLTIDAVTPGAGLASSNVMAGTPSVTVTAPKETGVLDEALKIDSILPGAVDTVKTEPVVVKSTPIVDEKLKNDVVTTEPVVVSSTPIVDTEPVTVTSTKLGEDLKTDPVVVTSTKIDDTIKAEPVTVTSTPLLDEKLKIDPVTTTTTPTSTTTGTTTTTTTTPATTAPAITIPPITLDPGVTVTRPVGTETSTDNTMDFQQPTVLGPELSTYYGMPYPNYLRPMDPYLPMGLAALMEAMYGQVSRDGNYQPIENAGAQIKIPT